MRRLFLCVLATAACAPAADPGPRTSPPERVVIASDAGSGIIIQRHQHLGMHTFPVAAEQLWNKLPDAYAELGLPVPELDPTNRIVAVQNHTVMRRLKTSPLSVYIDCGSDLTGQLADKNRVRMTVKTWLEPESATSTVVRTQLDASATSSERSGWFECTTTGALEERIAHAIALQFGG